MPECELYILNHLSWGEQIEWELMNRAGEDLNAN